MTSADTSAHTRPLFGAQPRALLALADGSVFHGRAIGARGHAVGEVVFNTAMTGYQEIITDPSYAGQIVTLTYPHIGNVGVNPEDAESTRVFAAGLVVRDVPAIASSWRRAEDLVSYLRRANVVGIADIDTRKLTRILREHGAQGGCIATADKADADVALRAARAFPGLKGMDLARVVSVRTAYQWNEGSIGREPSRVLRPGSRLHVVAYDFGIKRNILRRLVHSGCRVTVVPAGTTAEDVLALKPDGVFLSNGPGDPEPLDYQAQQIRKLVGKTPIFGICLGHQILGLALGGKTYKLKFGHRGANHPVLNQITNRVEITSHNHGFAVDADSLNLNELEITHMNLNDETLEGFRHRSHPVFCVQYHPEAAPGPHDSHYLFNDFVKLMDQGS